jgi:hypothetical protein
MDLRSIAQNDNPHGKEIDMAKVSQVSKSVVFERLTPIGAGIVDDFLRKHTYLKHEGISPADRTIKWSTTEEALLNALAKKVEASDPE